MLPNTSSLCDFSRQVKATGNQEAVKKKGGKVTQ